MKQFKLSDLLAYRGLHGVTQATYRLLANKVDFERQTTDYSKMNILQLAILFDFEKFVRYVLEEHKVLSNTRQPKNVDPRIILADEEDETFSLRLAIDIRCEGIFEFLWSWFKHLYDERHLLILLRFIIYTGSYKFIRHLLYSQTAIHIMQNAPLSARLEVQSLLTPELLENTEEHVREFLNTNEAFTNREPHPFSYEQL